MSRRESSVQVAPAAIEYSDRESLSSTATVSVRGAQGKGTTNGPAREPHMGLLTSCNMVNAIFKHEYDVMKHSITYFGLLIRV